MPGVDGPPESRSRKIITAVADGDFDGLRDELRQVSHDEVWIPLPALSVAAPLITLIVESRHGPWELDERIWVQHLPERVPAGRSEWRNATYALQAADCLAAGVWLDVGRQEPF